MLDSSERPVLTSGWYVTQLVMLSWLADEVIRVLRDDSAFVNGCARRSWRDLDARPTRAAQGRHPDFGEGMTQLIERFAMGWAPASEQERTER